MSRSGPPRAFVHVGLPKTGTSHLQSVVWANLAELRAQGLVVVPEPVGSTSKAQAGTQVMLAARDRLVAGHDPETATEVLDRFAAEVRAAGDADVLLTQEQLAACSTEQAAALLDRFGEREVHVVVTARAVSRQVPSAWQERVKTRSTTSYADFVAAARDRGEPARGFWRNQDLVAVLERWGGSLPPEQVHVVTVPTGGADSLDARYFGVLGVDHTRLQADRTRSNTSLGVVQAELLRRVNVALGDRLPKPRMGYARVAKWFLTEKFLVTQSGRPALLPESAQGWCRQLAEEWITTIGAAGYDVAGDLADLLPDPAHFTSGLVEVDDDDLLDAATRALADILVDRHDELARIDALRSRIAELEQQRPARRWFRR
ncbi:MAG TPA: hypothetical protein VFE07_04855 [Marmoricola sp.]|nr:hypothetical protein [Marmoricola sp.]